MDQKLYSRIGPTHHIRLAKFGANNVVASDRGITSKRLLCEIGLDAGEILSKDCRIKVPRQSWDIEDFLACRNGQGNCSTDALLGCR